MVFKSDKQRKKVMAMLTGGTKSDVNPQVITKTTTVKTTFSGINDPKVDDIFRKVQKERGITTGDFPPDATFELDAKIKRGLNAQGVEKFVNKFYDSTFGEKISKSEFQSFVRVRDSGVTNMFDTRAVSQFSGLEKDKIIKIMKNFGSLSKKYPGVVR